MRTMKDKEFECLAKQAIEKVVVHLKTVETRVEHTVYTEDFYLGFQLGFYLYYDYGIKDYKIYASVRNEEGFAARCGPYKREELSLNPDFVSTLVDEYIHLMKEADISEQDYGNRGLWEEEMCYSTSVGGSSCGSTVVLPKPFECSVTKELYLSLGIRKEVVMDAVRRLLDYCKENRKRHVDMHNTAWWIVECVLTHMAGYEIGVRIRYGDFCPICKDEDDTYWQMETCSYCQLVNDDTVERLSDYYVFLLALQRGLISSENKPEVFFINNIATPSLFYLTKGVVYI